MRMNYGFHERSRTDGPNEINIALEVMDTPSLTSPKLGRSRMDVLKGKKRI